MWQVADLSWGETKSRAGSRGVGKAVLIHNPPHRRGQPLPASCVVGWGAVELMLGKLNWVWAAAKAGARTSPGRYCCTTH